MRIGFHVSINNSIEKAVDRANKLNCNTFQMFTRNPRGWNVKKIPDKKSAAFIEKVNRYDMKPVYGHMPYLSNLASPRKDVYTKSIEALKIDLDRCKKLKIPYLITHLGSHLGTGKIKGFKRITEAIDTVFETIEQQEVMLLLENTAGTKNSMGSSFEDIQQIIDHLNHPEKVGVCFDTSHAFAAGYDLRTESIINKTIQKFNNTIGFEKLKLIHLNDSTGDLDSHIDRHEHIGLGKIGEEGFRSILRSELGQLPLILETPKDKRRNDIENLIKIRELANELTPEPLKPCATILNSGV